MRHKRKYTALFIGLLCSFYLRAQDSLATHTVPAIEVIAPRGTAFNSGTKDQRIDSATLIQYKNGTLTDLLSQQGSLFIKTYGMGSLATPTFRGTSFTQTAILWNGFNLQSPMNQTFDFSLIPAFFMDNVDVQFGSGSALYGSGALGGTIQLKNTAAAAEGVHGSAMLNEGSFATRQQNLKLSYRHKFYTGRVRYMHQQAENDFTFKNTARLGYPEQKQPHADVQQQGVLFENFFNIGKNQLLQVNAWYQQADRNIPPTMLQGLSVANQKDNVWRVTAEWQKRGTYSDHLLRMAYFNERIRYTDSIAKIFSDNSAYSSISEYEFRHRFGSRHQMVLGANSTYHTARTPDYGPMPPEQWRPAIFGSYKFKSSDEKINASLSLRQEWVNGKAIPFIPTLGGQWDFYEKNRYLRQLKLTLLSKASRVYRLPSFNDLYWAVGGNPALKPEQGYSAEWHVKLATRFNQKDKSQKIVANWPAIKRSYTAEITAGIFYNDINDWILWLPWNAGVWSPLNVAKVVSKGAEISTKLEMTGKKLRVTADARYSYVLSTNEKKKSQFDESYKKQLVYVPKHNLTANLTFSYKNYMLRYNQVYTGLRYTTTDNSASLDAYHVGSLYLAKSLQLSQNTLLIGAQVNNIYNSQYMVMEWRPMPGRNYQLNIQINF